MRFTSLGCLPIATFLAACAAQPPSPPAQPVAVVVVDAQPAKKEPAIVDTRVNEAEQLGLELRGVQAGMDRAELETMLGPQQSSRDFEDTKAWWESSGYDTSAVLPFLIGFDQMGEYSKTWPDGLTTWWNVYFAGDRAAMLKVGVRDEASDHKFGFEPTCFLGSPASAIPSSFGPPTLTVDQEEHGELRTFVYHLDRGVAFLVIADRLQVIDLFEPIAGTSAARMAEALRKK